MKRRILFLIAAFVLIAVGVRAESPVRVLDNAVAKLKKASGISCRFTIKNPDGTMNGAFKSEGRKFYLDTPAGKTWYDGESMYTSNPRSKEVTVVRPTAQELSEVNPFRYLEGYKTQSVIGFSKRKDAERYLVVLNPKDKKSGIKAVEIAINKKTALPEWFIIRDSKDKITTVTVKTLSLRSGSVKESVAFPAGEYKDYEIVDLR